MSTSETSSEGSELGDKVQESIKVLEKVENEFDDPVLTCSFGKDSMAVVHLAMEADTDVAFAFLDHGVHFEETLDLKQEVEEDYGLDFEVYEPEKSYGQLVEEHGQKVHEEKPDVCCSILKSEPMERAIEGHDAWITGYRRSESRGSEDESYPWRAEIEFFEDQGEVVRVNPIAHWTAEDVWRYHDRHGIPYNPLYDEGHDCLGCHPCTVEGDSLFAYDSLKRVGSAGT